MSPMSVDHDMHVGGITDDESRFSPLLHWDTAGTLGWLFIKTTSKRFKYVLFSNMGPALWFIILHAMLMFWITTTSPLPSLQANQIDMLQLYHAWLPPSTLHYLRSPQSLPSCQNIDWSLPEEIQHLFHSLLNSCYWPHQGFSLLALPSTDSPCKLDIWTTIHALPL